jgi:L-alanine-DL-glutamate epimerase-like enolase superfamily enzyme
MALSGSPIRRIGISVYTVPADAPEADGTFTWNSTTLVLAEISAGDEIGIGYTYGSLAVATLAEHLADTCLRDQSPLDIPHLHAALLYAVRNDGSRGIGAMAISVLDIALWDLKARLLGCSVSQLLGRAQTSVAVYGSGGFTSYTNAQLTDQFTTWTNQGIRKMKMKVGSAAAADPARVKTARKAIGSGIELFVDANGAYTTSQALALADIFAEQNVSWFEEPVSSDHLEQLHLIRQRAPSGMAIAAGEYGYDPFYFRRMLEAGAVDVLQADATRCRGFTGFLHAAAIAASFGCPLSAHCAPTLHMHVGCAVPALQHIEYFHDHVRIEQMLFDGFIAQKNGRLEPEISRPGLGLIFKRKDAERYAA